MGQETKRERFTADNGVNNIGQWPVLSGQWSVSGYLVGRDNTLRSISHFPDIVGSHVSFVSYLAHFRWLGSYFPPSETLHIYITYPPAQGTDGYGYGYEYQVVMMHRGSV